jgi:hypothetical protein
MEAAWNTCTYGQQCYEQRNDKTRQEDRYMNISLIGNDCSHLLST